MKACVLFGYLKRLELGSPTPLMGLPNPGDSPGDRQHPVGGPPWSGQVVARLNEMKNVKDRKINNIL